MTDKSLNALSSDLDSNKMVGKLNYFYFILFLSLVLYFGSFSRRIPLFFFHNLFFSRLQSGSRSMSMLVRAVLLDKKPEEVPMVSIIIHIRFYKLFWTGHRNNLLCPFFVPLF